MNYRYYIGVCNSGSFTPKLLYTFYYKDIQNISRSGIKERTQSAQNSTSIYAITINILIKKKKNTRGAHVGHSNNIFLNYYYISQKHDNYYWIILLYITVCFAFQIVNNIIMIRFPPSVWFTADCETDERAPLIITVLIEFSDCKLFYYNTFTDNIDTACHCRL